ncbi:hypothetical protein ACFY7Z_31355 [Streptomyces sp. NPDC012623]|uniref:hypothetical protein n=1 Tax=unclassified Streptomyces TaxID=2593676 RepID=UPI00367D44D8
MTGNVKIGVALVGGYLLGRTKKAKLAIGLGMFLAGKKLNLDPKQLGKMVANSPVLGTLNDQVRKELVDATKSAATHALTQRASGLADSLHQRTLDLDGRAVPAEDDEDGDEDDRDTRADADTDGDDSHDEGDEKRAPRRRTAAKQTAKPAAKAASGARRTASGRTGDTRKRTSTATRKTASGARKSASSAGRKERGGSNG